MAIETKVEEKPEQITSLADWLTSSLEPAVSASGDRFSSARTILGSEWQGETAEAIVSWLADAVGASDSLSTRITDIATALTTYASILLSVKTEAECVRSDATAGGLVVSGTVVQEPKDTADTKKAALYSSLSVRMSTANSKLATGQQDLRSSMTSKDVDRVKNDYQIFSIVAEAVRSAAPPLWTIHVRRALTAEGSRLISMSKGMEKMIVGGLSQGVRNPANARAANAALNEATRLELKGRGMKGQAASYKGGAPGSKLGNSVKIGGAALAVVGTGIGYWADRQRGESGEQAFVSNVAATATGSAAGIAASSLTGAAIGSVFPGPGTAIGGAIGFVVGVAISMEVSTMTDKFVDSLYEDNKGVMHAAGEGLTAAADLKRSVVNGAMNTAKDVGNGVVDVAKGIGDTAKKTWDKLGW